jgi:hypothetical protein
MNGFPLSVCLGALVVHVFGSSGRRDREQVRWNKAAASYPTPERTRTLGYNDWGVKFRI